MRRLQLGGVAHTLNFDELAALPKTDPYLRQDNVPKTSIPAASRIAQKWGLIMPDKTLRYLIVSVIVLLLIFQIGTLISEPFGMVRGSLSAIAVVAILFFSEGLSKTRGENSFWFFLPILLFTAVSIILMGWNVMTENVSWFERVVRLAPFIVGFGAPIALLLIVYYELRKRTFNDQP